MLLVNSSVSNVIVPGRLAQSVTCLTTDACLTATFAEIDHEIISTVILIIPLNHSRRDVVSYKRTYVHEVLVNRLFKLAQEKVWLGELTIPPHHDHSCCLGRKAKKQTNQMS